MKSILITGSSGLVGKALNAIHSSYQYNFIFVSSTDCDLRNYEQTKTLFEKIKPTYCIHLAANVGGLLKNMNHKITMLEDNLIMNYNVVKCCHVHSVMSNCHVVHKCLLELHTQSRRPWLHID